MLRRLLATSVALGALLSPFLAAAQSETESDRMRAMEDRLRSLEARLEQSEQVIEQQRAALGTSGGADVSQGSAIDAFLSSVEVGGSVTASYTYSFNNPETSPSSQTLCQFNCNHNEFSLDAFKLELGKKAPNPGDVGFQFDLLLGRNAGIFNQLSPDIASFINPAVQTTADRSAADTELFVQEAYLSYNMNGVELKAGKFETPLGFEVIDSNDNPNVTHGILFTFAIPLFHTGVLASGNISEELSWAAGLTNGFNNTRETGDDKAVLGRLAYTSGPLFLAYNLYYGTLGEVRTSTGSGALVGDNAVKTQIHDVILQYTPSDSFTTWINADYGKTERRPESTGALFNDQGTDPTFFGVAIGAKQKLSDKLYVAARGEYMNDDNASRFGALFTGGVAPFDFDEIDVYSATLTLGYQIQPNLLTRLELRRDKVDCDSPSCAVFRDSSNGGTEKNDFGIVELVYSFD